MSVRVLLVCDDESRAARLRAQVEAVGGTLVDDPSTPQLIVADARADDVERRVREASVHRRVEVLALLHDDAAATLDDATAALYEPVSDEDLRRHLIRLQRRYESGSITREQLLAVAVEAAGDVVEISDANHVLEYVNGAFERILGYAAEEVIGRPSSEVAQSQLQDKQVFQSLRDAVGDGSRWGGLVLSKAKDGRLVQFESTVAPVLDERGRVSHHVAVKRDVTEHVAAEAELHALNEVLEQARDAALEASRVKSQFLANMSHELRTPLNAIIGYTEMLAENAEDRDDAEALADLGRVGDAAHHLLSLVNDVLDLSKIEAGQMELKVEPCALRGLIDDVVATVQPLSFERGNEIVVDYRLAYPDVEIDVIKLRQLLLNLLSNANKFTDRGPILICAHEARDSGVGGVERFEIDVSDTGIGIPPEKLQRVFDPFVQVDGSTTRKHGGTGLGLAISQRFCQLMGGELTVESELGQGSTFTVRLPRRVEAEAAE